MVISSGPGGVCASKKSAVDVVDYGYGDDVVPSATSQSDKDNEVDYGYGDVSASASTSTRSRGTGTSTGTGQEEVSAAAMPKKLPRRSSLKLGSAYGPETRSDEPCCCATTTTRTRRASISCPGEINIEQKPPQQRQRRPSISFRNCDEVKEVESVRSLTDEPSKLWIQKDELDRIRKQACLLVNLARQRQQQFSIRSSGSSPSVLVEEEDTTNGNQTTICTRGLERFLDDREAQHRIQESRYSVLAEQDHQRALVEAGCAAHCNDAVLRRIYAEAVAESCDKARDRAEIDHAHMRQDYRIARRRMRRMSVS